MNDITQQEGETAGERKPGLLRRIVAFPLTLLVLGMVWFLFAYGLSAVASSRRLPTGDTPLEFVIALAFAAFAVLSYKGFKRWIERAPDREFALAGAPREFGWGLLLGLGLFSTITGVVTLLGGFEVLGLRGVGQLWPMLSLAVLSGFYEETLFRGVIFRHLETMLGSWAALAITSAFFGLSHIANPGATWFAAFAIAVEAGILLGAAFMLTRRLWLPIGIHAAWNFAQGWIFSAPVSGGRAPLGLLITRLKGPEWLSGGAFGLEASVIALVVATTAGLVMMRRVVQNKGTVAPMWSRSRAGETNDANHAPA